MTRDELKRESERLARLQAEIAACKTQDEKRVLMKREGQRIIAERRKSLH